MQHNRAELIQQLMQRLVVALATVAVLGLTVASHASFSAAGITARCFDSWGCEDGNPCTDDVCSAGFCKRMPIDGCTSCTTVVDCFDDNPCTIDGCNAGVCEHVVIDGCMLCQQTPPHGPTPHSFGCPRPS